MCPGEEATAVEKRQVAGEHGKFGGNRSTIGGHGYTGLLGRDLKGPRVLVDRSTHRHDPAGEPDAIAPRVEVQLIVQTYGRLDRVRQFRRRSELDRYTDPPTRFSLALDV